MAHSSTCSAEIRVTVVDSGSVSGAVSPNYAAEFLELTDDFSRAAPNRSSAERSIRNAIASLTTYLPDFVGTSTTAITADYLPNMVDIIRSSKRYRSELAQQDDSAVTHCALAVHDAARMYPFPRL